MSTTKEIIHPKTIFVNLIGGPGTGKSILCKDVFSAIKRGYISCEESPEYIKKKLREQALKVVQSQIYIFAKQQFQQFSLQDTVEVAVTDSPIILSPIYDPTQCKFLRGLALKEYKKYRNIMYYIERDPNAKYEQEGRYQDLEGAKKIDAKIKTFLKKNKIKYKVLHGIGKDSLDTIVKDVQKEVAKFHKHPTNSIIKEDKKVTKTSVKKSSSHKVLVKIK